MPARPLDPIHLASALSVRDPQLELVTYDERLARTAARHHLIVLQPVRSGKRTATRRA